MHCIFLMAMACLLPSHAFATSNGAMPTLNLHMTDTPWAVTALVLFAVAYFFVMTEELTQLRKSKPVVIAAGIIWLIVGIICQQNGLSTQAKLAVKQHILEYSELFMFLLVAMTYINAMEERLIFDSLRSYLVRMGFSYRQLFWLTGLMSFFMSPFADNLTTALLMCAVVTAVGSENKTFLGIACINIIVAANSGGAFSPFGDITTLMVWQKSKLAFSEFLFIFIPSLISFLIPASILHFAIPRLTPSAPHEVTPLRFGAKRVILLFFCTIITAICFHKFLNLPPMVGMMTGLGYLNIFAYYLKKNESRLMRIALRDTPSAGIDRLMESQAFDIFNKIKRAEWDTLFFFYGVMLSIGGLATLGYLEILSHTMYTSWGANFTPAYSATPANIVVGFLSAIVDNIPMMYAVLTMDPAMSHGQWLLVTLTAGIGGSMLPIGSAAGVALMGQLPGKYTFFCHLKWSWAIALGYIGAIATHLLLNKQLF